MTTIPAKKEAPSSAKAARSSAIARSLAVKGSAWKPAATCTRWSFSEAFCGDATSAIFFTRSTASSTTLRSSANNRRSSPLRSLRVSFEAARISARATPISAWALLRPLLAWGVGQELACALSGSSKLATCCGSVAAAAEAACHWAEATDSATECNLVRSSPNISARS